MTREEAIQILSTRDAHGVLCGYTSGVTEALGMAIEALSADAVEVVRCKDCIRTKERDEYTGLLWCSIHRGYMEDTYYCADGLRRGDDEA